MRFCSGGIEGVPSASTVTEIVRRNGCVDAAEGVKHCAHDMDGCYDVVYCAFRVAHVDMKTTRPTVTHVFSMSLVCIDDGHFAVNM